MIKGHLPLLEFLAESKKKLYYRPIYYFDLFFYKFIIEKKIINLARTCLTEFWLNSAMFKYNQEKLVFQDIPNIIHMFKK